MSENDDPMNWLLLLLSYLLACLAPGWQADLLGLLTEFPCRNSKKGGVRDEREKKERKKVAPRSKENIVALFLLEFVFVKE